MEKERRLHNDWGGYTINNQFNLLNIYIYISLTIYDIEEKNIGPNQKLRNPAILGSVSIVSSNAFW